MKTRKYFLIAISLSACSVEPGSGGAGFSASGTQGTSDTPAMTTTAMAMTTGPAVVTGSSTDVDPIFDVGNQDLPVISKDCTVREGAMNAIPPCMLEAPPDSFSPAVQWEWEGYEGDKYSGVIPLVANLTDDNGDGNIDLCDTPDVIVVAYTHPTVYPAHMYVLDGETGEMHFQVEQGIAAFATPALGDIDGDGLVEIVALLRGPGSPLVAFEHDGTLKWEGDPAANNSGEAPTIALADLDADGDVEIIGPTVIADHLGNTLWEMETTGVANHVAPVAADMDGDGDLEIVVGHRAYHHDGTIYYDQPSLLSAGVYAQVANMDDDPEPEVLVLTNEGVSLLENDGTIIYQNLTPSGDPAMGNNWGRPATIHDFNGDGIAEYAVSSADHYGIYEADGTVVWLSVVDDSSGAASGTAFDFLGDGRAEAMYADEFQFHIFDNTGFPYLSVPRASSTLIEYPVVADVDNDGSAEIVVVSNEGPNGTSAALVQVIRDIEDRWIPARRIWNQHTYHVTNVREDGTIPQNEVPSWEVLNTFRTNSQIDDKGICIPAG